MDCSTSGLPVLYYLLELAQTQVPGVNDAIQPSHPAPCPPFPPALNLELTVDLNLSLPTATPDKFPKQLTKASQIQRLYHCPIPSGATGATGSSISPSIYTYGPQAQQESCCFCKPGLSAPCFPTAHSRSIDSAVRRKSIMCLFGLRSRWHQAWFLISGAPTALLLPAPRGSPYALAHDLLSPSSKLAMGYLFGHPFIVTSHSDYSTERFSAFKGPCDDVGPIWTI